jgi:hypothetical protein
MSVPDSPNGISDQDIERYKFGMDRGCRDAGVKKGAPQPETDSFCDCMRDTLNSKVPKSAWQQAMYHALKRQGREEMQALSHYTPDIEQCRVRDALKEAAFSKSAGAKQSVLGSWEWTRKANLCGEVYTFAEDGTVSVISGDEKTENIYEFSEQPERSGRYKLKMTVTKDFGGRDCSDSTDDSTGMKSEVFILFSPDSSMLAMCTSASGPECFGPLKRRAQ